MQCTYIWGLPLAQRGPMELSGMIETFHIGAVQYGSHQTQVAVVPEATETKELKLKWYLMLTNLNLNNHMWPVATLSEIAQLWSQAPGSIW